MGTRAPAAFCSSVGRNLLPSLFLPLVFAIHLPSLAQCVPGVPGACMVGLLAGVQHRGLPRLRSRTVGGVLAVPFHVVKSQKCLLPPFQPQWFCVALPCLVLAVHLCVQNGTGVWKHLLKCLDYPTNKADTSMASHGASLELSSCSVRLSLPAPCWPPLLFLLWK